jgi:hypothetical protein
MSCPWFFSMALHPRDLVRVAEYGDLVCKRWLSEGVSISRTKWKITIRSSFEYSSLSHLGLDRPSHVIPVVLKSYERQRKTTRSGIQK